VKKLYITLIVLALAAAMIVPVGVVSADPGQDIQAFIYQFDVTQNPAAKAEVANMALQNPGSVAQMAIAYASVAPAGAAFVAGPTGAAGTPVLISDGCGNCVAALY
jgi:hypothetical protein